MALQSIRVLWQMVAAGLILATFAGYSIAGESPNRSSLVVQEIGAMPGQSAFSKTLDIEKHREKKERHTANDDAEVSRRTGIKGEKPRSIKSGIFTPLLASFQLKSPEWEHSDDAEAGEGESEESFRNRIKSAVRNHPSVRAGVFDERRANEAVKEAEAGYYPQIGGALESGISRGRNTSDSSRDATDAPDLVLTVEQLLYDFGQTSERVAAAAERKKSARLGSLNSAQEFTLRAISTYLDVVRIQTLQKLAFENLDQHQRIVDRLEERTQGGVGVEADLYRAEGRLADARSILIDYMGQYEQIRAAFQEVFSEEPAHNSLPVFRPVIPQDVEQALTNARQKNLSLMQSSADVDAARSEFEAERAARLPSFSLALEGRRYGNQIAGFSDHDITAQVRVEYDIYTGGAETAKRTQAKFQYSKAIEQQSSRQREIERQVRSAFTDIRSRREKVRALEFAVKADQLTADSYLELFGIGRRNMTDILDAQRDLFQTSLQMVNARIEYEMSHYILTALTGRLLNVFEIRNTIDE